MLMSEFIERTNFYPSFDEYRGIEELYYHYQGDKDAFCEEFNKNKEAMMNRAREIAVQLFVQERERLLSNLHKAEMKQHEEQRLREYDAKEAARNYQRLQNELNDYKGSAKQVVSLKDETIERQCKQILDLERENADLKAQLDALKRTIKLLKDE